MTCLRTGTRIFLGLQSKRSLPYPREDLDNSLRHTVEDQCQRTSRPKQIRRQTEMLQVPQSLGHRLQSYFDARGTCASWQNGVQLEKFLWTAAVCRSCHATKLALERCPRDWRVQVS